MGTVGRERHDPDCRDTYTGSVLRVRPAWLQWKLDTIHTDTDEDGPTPVDILLYKYCVQCLQCAVCSVVCMAPV